MQDGSNRVTDEDMRRPLRILLVEDDEDDYILTQALVREFRWSSPELHWESEFDRALEAMLSDAYDVYLLDYRLGPHSGLDLLQAAIAKGCKAPIILLTGQGDHEVDLQAMRVGAADYLVKGTLDAPNLERAIRYAIQQRRVLAELAETRMRLAERSEIERLHLAQELHDGPLQDLIGARFHLGVLSNMLNGNEAHAQLNMVQDGLQSVINTLRVLCGQLRPPALAPFGLEKAIRAYVQTFQEQYPQISVELELDADNQELPTRVRLALFRIFQTALSNVARHADATHVRVHFRMTDRQLLLRVVDDGRGFRVPASWLDFARDGHFGLLGAMERAESIGGQLVVESAPGSGTSLMVRAPRPQDSQGEPAAVITQPQGEGHHERDPCAVG
jgi:signal transduction histidine kinase